jgi:rSAM/selenodomain-associated transferase 2
MGPKTISIIIPTYNEEAIIAEIIEKLLAMTQHTEGVEIIFSDASSDRTPDLLTSFPVKVCRSAKGRAVQMNTGARVAEGAILYFLHADSRPPQTFIEDIRSAVESGKQAGCFQMQFDDPHPIMSLYGWFTRFPFPLCRGGDQSLFITKELFQSIGGFNETMQVMEDIDIITRLEKQTAFHILDNFVITSARKYHKNGFLNLQMIFGTIHLMYALGADQESLVRYYTENIS